MPSIRSFNPIDLRPHCFGCVFLVSGKSVLGMRLPFDAWSKMHDCSNSRTEHVTVQAIMVTFERLKRIDECVEMNQDSIVE